MSVRMERGFINGMVGRIPISIITSGKMMEIDLLERTAAQHRPGRDAA